MISSVLFQLVKDAVAMLSHGFVMLTALAWLVPNHYPPWVSAWSEALAIFGLLMLVLVVLWRTADGFAISRILTVAAFVCVVSVAMQLVAGKVIYRGDALMVVLYIGIWLMAVLAGRLIAASPDDGELLNTLHVGWVFAAIASVGIALTQWTGAVKLYIYAAELPPGARPFANVAQPNHFSTICFLGLCGLLWLRQVEKISSSTLAVGAIFIALGMLMSQSRTGWLQVGFLVLCGMALRNRLGLRVSGFQLMVFGVIFGIGVALWQRICGALLLPVSRQLADQMHAGQRLPYWGAMLDAIGREPLFGYGWMQVGLAQQRVAVDHPVIGTIFGYSHNLLLDMVLWCGLPVGVFVASLLAWWFVGRVQACCNARAAVLVAALVGMIIHAMLEYPLAYAYFLIPAGLVMGAIEGLTWFGGGVVRFSRRGVAATVVVLCAAFSAVACEYAVMEEKFRDLRFELARIGVDRLPPPLPEGRLITQLDSFVKFYRMEARPGMSAADLEFMRSVSHRYGFSTVMLRYALAEGLNGRPDVARETLARLCHIHARRRCDEAYDNWRALQGRYPQLPDAPPEPASASSSSARGAVHE